MRNKKITVNLIKKSKVNLKDQKFLKNYKKVWKIKKMFFNLEKIILILKWEFDAVKLNELNYKIAQNIKFSQEEFRQLILDVFIDKSEKEFINHFLYFYLFAIQKYFFRKKKKIEFLIENVYETKNLYQLDAEKRSYYYKFLKSFENYDNYNSRLRKLFTKLPFLLTKA
ncbi:hypothetical protein [Mycoplasmopsis columbina]|uniref:hypothetical protein n=1 Tax=Mycoplasmopsis columbina TaxID=114881 RepID=UPI0004A76229|nr:hypothetical protein [Mycoplasmopsis columbina]VEU76796.1 Uncharacterised protein [Mycoplasmopsis columbina]